MRMRCDRCDAAYNHFDGHKCAKDASKKAKPRKVAPTAPPPPEPTPAVEEPRCVSCNRMERVIGTDLCARCTKALNKSAELSRGPKPKPKPGGNALVGVRLNSDLLNRLDAMRGKRSRQQAIRDILEGAI